MNDTIKSSTGNDLLARAMRKVFSETSQKTVKPASSRPDEDARDISEGERP